MHIDRISKELPILYFKVTQKFLNYDAFQSLKIVFIFANSADPDEMLQYKALNLGLHQMLQYAASHLGLHCLPNTLCWYTELKELIQVPFKSNIFILFNFLFSENERKENIILLRIG